MLAEPNDTARLCLPVARTSGASGAIWRGWRVGHLMQGERRASAAGRATWPHAYAQKRVVRVDETLALDANIPLVFSNLFRLLQVKLHTIRSGLEAYAIV